MDEVVRSFAEVDRVETSALLAAIGELAPDELVRARARRAIAGRGHPLPGWLGLLGRAKAGRVMEMVHVLGDGDNVMVEVLLPAPKGAAAALSIVVYIDHNLGTVVKDAFVVPRPLADLVAMMKEHSEAPNDTEWRDLGPGAARARITEAVQHGALMYPPFESDSWPACRPLVEWAARLLPEGGTGYLRPEWDDGAKAALTEAFFASPHARGLDDHDQRDLFESVLWFATDYGPGDPLRWSPSAVEILLLDWLPRKIVAPAQFLAKAPRLLRAFIAYAHGERRIRPGLTDETLAAVDRFEPDYQKVVRSPRPQGPAALLAAMGVLDPDGPFELPGALDKPYDNAAIMLELLRRAVGGEDALGALDDRALPDEPFAWDGIDNDIGAKVAEVLEQCDRCCNEILDTEYRTACRRFLAMVARGGPEVFRRRSKTETASAAICWTIGKANELFTPGAGGMLAKDLLSHFGIAQGSVAQRAATMMKAAHIAPAHDYYPSWDIALGDPGLLVSARRRRIIDRRDRYSDTR